MSLPAMGNVTSGEDVTSGLYLDEQEAACTERLSEVDWTRATILASFLVLGVINVMVIVGNTLVIAAVFLSSKLRTVTNLFIVSLAVSDLLVGIAVLPFSTSYEVLSVWIFGDIWCQMWLAVDVWMCTASILNLCAISLDRYVAVTRPVSYPSIMSSRRAKILIAIVWSLSFVICLPPLVGWNDTSGSAAAAALSASTATADQSVTNGLFTSADVGNVSSTLLNFDGGGVGGEAGGGGGVGSGSTRSILSYRSDNDIFESLDINYEDYERKGNNELNLSDLVNNNLGGAVRHVMDVVLSIRSNGEGDNARGERPPLPDDPMPEWTAGMLLSNISEVLLNGSIPATTGSNVSGGGGSYGRANMNATTAAPCTCLLISDKGYRIYSALGSFYLPMLVMMFFYWKIYRAAIETTRAINQGFRTTKSVGGGGSGIGGRFDEQRLTLRIHRGRSSTDLYGNGSCGGERAFRAGHHHHRRRLAVRNSSLKDKWSAPAGRSGHHHHRGISGMTFPPSSDSAPRKQCSLQSKPKQCAGDGDDAAGTSGSNHMDGNGATGSGNTTPVAETATTNYSRRRAATRQNHWTSVQCKTTAGGSTQPVTSTYAAITAAAALGPPPSDVSPISPCGGATCSERFEFVALSDRGEADTPSSSQTKGPPPSPSPREELQQQNGGGGSKGRGNECGDGSGVAGTGGQQIFAKMGKRNIKAQVKRFRTETKAAKTLGIIVGGFILCWLPFFTTYLVGAFCAAEDCIPETLFSVFFWLGYCNSAINPCVYAFFSRDFRHAFKSILCRCFMRREHSVKERLATMLPASLQLASFFEESEDGSNSH